MLSTNGFQRDTFSQLRMGKIETRTTRGEMGGNDYMSGSRR